MLSLVVAWTTTRSRKRHGETLECCTYIQLFTTRMWYLQIFVRFRLNKGEKKTRQFALMKWLLLFVWYDTSLIWTFVGRNRRVPHIRILFEIARQQSGPVCSIFGILYGKIEQNRGEISQSECCILTSWANYLWLGKRITRIPLQLLLSFSGIYPSIPNSLMCRQILTPIDLNWVQHCVSRLRLFK